MPLFPFSHAHAVPVDKDKATAKKRILSLVDVTRTFFWSGFLFSYFVTLVGDYSGKKAVLLLKEKSGMEKGADASSGFSVSEKKSSSNSYFVSSMKLQTGTEASSTSKICMMGSHHQGNNLDRPIAGHDGRRGGGGGGVGPANNVGGANEVMGSIYGDDVSSSLRGGGENFVKSTNLEPFDIFPFAYSSIPYKSPAGGMTTSVGFPFTSAQWTELERQAMIYKYMISSVPVPLDLLFPISRNFPAPAADSSISSIYNVRFSKNGDLEPGRCKRTDGKKWRCSRDVAPNQKYCERHLHRGRPRSRKPVEVKINGENHKKTRIEQSRSLPTAQSNSAASQQFVAANDEPLLLFNSKTDLSISTPYYKGTHRDLGLSERDGAEQQWQHLMEANVGLLANEGFSGYSSGAPIFNQDYVGQQQPSDVFSYPNFPAPEIEVPNGFIDAWSINDNLNSRKNASIESSISLNEGDLSPSLNLSMAMAAGNVLDEQIRNNQLLGSKYWEPFARGGPLGEALQPTDRGSNPASPYNSIGTVAATVSSPSGVLHRTLFSHSDGSVCNSPTFVAPP